MRTRSEQHKWIGPFTPNDKIAMMLIDVQSHGKYLKTTKTISSMAESNLAEIPPYGSKPNGFLLVSVNYPHKSMPAPASSNEVYGYMVSWSHTAVLTGDMIKLPESVSIMRMSSNENGCSHQL